MIGFAEADAAKLVKACEEKGFFKGNPVSIIKRALSAMNACQIQCRSQPDSL